MEIGKKELAALPLIFEGPRDLIYRWDACSHGPVVIKLLKHLYAEPREMIRFANEYNVTKKLAIRGVRRACDNIAIDGLPALLLEYVEGDTLRSAFVEKRRPLPETLTTAVAIAGVVEELHRSGIMHRSISSSNILVDPPRHAVTLIDFGSASKGGQETALPERLDSSEESRHYISPEQTGRMNRAVDYRTDLYSLGVVLYEVLTGKLPFEETADLAELVHCHIARNPAPPCEVDPSVPAVLSDIVLKLMAKSPDDRYQSAHGLKADLETCLWQLGQTGTMGSFELAREDFSALFRIPQRLYGREPELELLKAALDRVRGGAAEVVLVAGGAGIGKSALVGEFQRLAADSGAVFITGKHNEYQRNTPYFALIQALAGLVNLMLMESAEQLARWKTRIMQAVGTGGALLTDLVPRLELVIGRQPSPPEPDPTEAQHRFRQAFQNLVLCVARKEAPLVVFLDNLQWVDDASLTLLRTLLTGTENHHLLFIGAYRDGETGPDHPLAATIESLKKEAAVTSLKMENLSCGTLNALVSETLRCEPAQARPLADLVHEKTAGTPLFALQFLQSLADGGLLAFDPMSRSWQWDLERIRTVEITGSVVALMTEKIGKLPRKTQELLSLAACIGSVFTVTDLAAVAGQQAGQTLEDLFQAIEEGVLLPREGSSAEPAAAGEAWEASHYRFEFLHDRVRKAFYSLVPKKQMKAVHLKIGRLQLEKLPDAELEERVFELADHFNEGFQYLSDQGEKLRVAELNLIAGRKAKRAAAYQAAIWYLNMGMGMLPADKWQGHYELTLNLYLEAVEAEYQCGNFERGEMLSAEVMSHVRDILVRFRIYQLKIMFHTAQARDAEALGAGYQAPDEPSAETAALGSFLQELGKELLVLVREKPVSLDAEAIIKASHTLSQEIRLEQLLDKLMHIVIENAGAQKGILIENRNGTLLVQAKGEVGRQRIETMQETPLEQSGELPVSVVRYVARTQTPVVSDDACAESAYAADRYIAEHRTKSLLCLPIVHKAKLTGILYLENNLTPGAFTPDRLGMLKALSSQAAISMENAALYADLEKKIEEVKRSEEALNRLNEQLEQRVRERTAELESKNEELERMNKLFIGRELRMVELKGKISELEKKAGQ